MPNPQSLVTHHGQAVWQTVCRLLDDDDDASECYQQTFLDALRVKDESVQDWRAVLCRIATRRAIDVLRRRYRQRAKFQPIDVDPASDAPPDTDLLMAELREIVRQTLATLPELQAEAFWLRHIEQLSPHEIGKQLNVDPGHVRVLVHRAATHLRQTLGPTYGNLFAMGTDQ